MALTRADEDAIIEAATVAYRVCHYRMLGYWPGPGENEESVRASLRLDDDKLIRIINEHPGGLSWTS